MVDVLKEGKAEVQKQPRRQEVKGLFNQFN